MNTNRENLQSKENFNNNNYGTYEMNDYNRKKGGKTNYAFNGGGSNYSATNDTNKLEDYDPYDNGNTENPTTFGGTLFHLCIMSAGPSVLSIPQTFLSIGVVVGCLGTIILVWLYGYNIHVFVKSEYELCKIYKTPHLSYFETVYYAFKEGPSCTKSLAAFTRPVLYVIFVVLWLGYSACILALVGETIKNLYDSFYGTDINVQIPIYLVFVPLLILCWIRKLAFLVPLSFFANFLNVIVICIVIGHIIFDQTPWEKIVLFGSLNDLPLFVGAILFNITATGVIMPLKNEMREPRKFNSKLGVLSLAYPPMAVSFAVFGFFCCLKYGNNVGDNVVNNLPPEQLLTKICKGMFILSASFQFPLVVYIVFDLMWNNILREARDGWRYRIFWEYVTRTVSAVAVLVVTIAVPRADVFLSLCGTVLTPIDSVIMPSVVETLVLWRTKGTLSNSKGYLVKNFLLSCIATVLSVCGVIEVISLVSQYYS